jgi:hypothetical protein
MIRRCGGSHLVGVAFVIGFAGLLLIAATAVAAHGPLGGTGVRPAGAARSRAAARP